MNPMFVSSEKAAAALGMSEERFSLEVLQRGLIQEYRDRDRLMLRFDEVRDLLCALPLREEEFSSRLAELRERDEPKPNQRSTLNRFEVERVLKVDSRDIDELLKDRLLSSRSFLGQELFPADAVRRLIPRFNPQSGKELYTKFLESSAAQSAKLLETLQNEDEGAASLLSMDELDEEYSPKKPEPKEESGISIFDFDEEELGEGSLCKELLRDENEDTGLTNGLLDCADETDPSARTRIGLPLIEENSGLLDLSPATNEEDEEFLRLIEEDTKEKPLAEKGEFHDHSDRALLAQWKMCGDEISPQDSALANLMQRLARSTDPEAATKRRQILEEFAKRYDRIVLDCAKKHPEAFVTAWSSCAQIMNRNAAPGFWRSMRMRLASPGSEQRAAKAEIENAVRHASSKTRDLVKGYFALRLYGAAYEK
jgi:hypothetical protein